MTELLLHIGGEKTGSTTLQAFLTKNADVLMRRHGVLYPVSGLLSSGHGHFPVASAFVEAEQCEFVSPARRLRPSDVSAALADLARTRSPKLIVLSAEHFSSRLSRPALEHLAETVAPIPTTVLFYVRRQDQLAVSAHSTFLRCGGVRRLDLQRVSPETRYFNHLAVADDWAGVFGREKMIARSFDRLERGIEPDFLSVIGIERDSDFEPVEPHNRQMTLEEAEVLYAVNRHLPGREGTALTDGFDSYYRAQLLRERLLGIAAQELATHTPLGSLLTSDLSRSIMSAFADSNRELAAKYGVEIPDQPLPPAPAADVEFDRADLLAFMLARVGQELLALEEQASVRQPRALRSRMRDTMGNLKRYLRNALLRLRIRPVTSR